MNTLNFILFALYMALTVALGIWIGRHLARSPAAAE
jgi:hypothetical protein